MHESLLDHPDYVTSTRRSKNRKDLNEAINQRTRTNTSEFWIQRLNEAGVPCGPIYDIPGTFEDEQVKHLGIARQAPHPERGEITVVGQPISLTRTPQPERMRLGTPGLGEHTDEVLTDLGYNADAIADLRERGVI